MMWTPPAARIDVFSYFAPNRRADSRLRRARAYRKWKRGIVSPMKTLQRRRSIKLQGVDRLLVANGA